jgi:hypothetical protein
MIFSISISISVSVSASRTCCSLSASPTGSLLVWTPSLVRLVLHVLDPEVRSRASLLGLGLVGRVVEERPDVGRLLRGQLLSDGRLRLRERWRALGTGSTVSKLLGHSSISTTVKIYAHLIAGIGQRAVDGGAALIARTTPSQSGEVPTR